MIDQTGMLITAGTALAASIATYVKVRWDNDDLKKQMKQCDDERAGLEDRIVQLTTDKNVLERKVSELAGSISTLTQLLAAKLVL